MPKTQQVGVRRKSHGQNRVRRGGNGVAGTGHTSVSEKRCKRRLLGSVAFSAGSAGRGSKKDFALFGQKQNRKSGDDQWGKIQPGVRHNRLLGCQKRFRRQVHNRLQKLRSGAGKVSGCKFGFCLVRRRTARGHLPRVSNARAG